MFSQPARTSNSLIMVTVL